MTMTHVEHTLPTRSVSKSHVLRGLKFTVKTAVTWADRAKKRRDLRELLDREDRVLKDIGLQRDDVYREAHKWFWAE